MTDWQDKAACLNVDPAVFFPPGDKSPVKYAAARAVCRTCEVSTECLDYVMGFETQSERDGMWGGLSPRERDKSRGLVHRNCMICGTRFKPLPKQRYCSEACREVGYGARQDRYRERAA